MLVMYRVRIHQHQGGVAVSSPDLISMTRRSADAMRLMGVTTKKETSTRPFGTTWRDQRLEAAEKLAARGAPASSSRRSGA